MTNGPAATIEAQLRRGVSRLLADMGYGTLAEFKLTTGRRVDVIGLNDRSEFVIAEIKSSIADFRSDRKWREYLPFCDRFYFAVPADFPQSILPGDSGVIVADAYGGTIRRPGDRDRGQRHPQAAPDRALRDRRVLAPEPRLGSGRRGYLEHFPIKLVGPASRSGL